MGKNVYTEIKCHSLLPLDDIVAMITHPDCIPEVCIYLLEIFVFYILYKNLSFTYNFVGLACI